MINKSLKILIQQNEPREFIGEYLKLFKHEIYTVSTLDEIADALINIPIDACIVDLVDQPAKAYYASERYKYIDYIRYNSIDLPIIVVTDSNLENDRQQAFRYGADMYMTIPVNMPALLYQLEAFMRYVRPDRQQGPTEVYNVGGFMLNVDKKSLTDMEGFEVFLEPMAMNLLIFLARNNGRFVSKIDEAKYLYGIDDLKSLRDIDSRIFNIRRALRGSTAKLTTYPRQGHRLDC